MKNFIIAAASSLLAFFLGAGEISSSSKITQSLSKVPQAPTLEELKTRVPEFARAAAWLDGTKLLADKKNVELFQDILPGIFGEKITPGDLAHSYLFFATEDVKIYGAVIGKGRGTFTKLHNIFKRSSTVIKLSLEGERFLLVIWGKEPTPALMFKGKAASLNTLNGKDLISSTGVMKISKLPGNAPQKLLQEFPELAHLEKIHFFVENREKKSRIQFVFDNEKSPRKGFTFLNWGLTLLLLHKTATFRHIEQKVEKKELSLTLYDPPLGKIARKLVPVSTRKKKELSTQQKMKILASGLYLYAADHKNRFPEKLAQLHGAYLPEASVFRASYHKVHHSTGMAISYLFLLPGKNLQELKNPSTVPMLMEDPALLPLQRKHLFVICADGRSVKAPLFRTLSHGEYLKKIRSICLKTAQSSSAVK